MAFAELKSSGGRPKPIVAHVAWDRGGVPEERAITINPVEVVPHAPRWTVVVYSLLKDFGLPLLLGILAYFFQQVLQERSRVQAARNAILPTATTNAVKYLLPAASAVWNLKRTVGEAALLEDENKQREKNREAFFYFVFLFKRMRDVSRVGGGFFLDDPSSEQLAAECWRGVLRRASSHFGYLDLSYVMDLMEGKETISQFLDQLQSTGETASLAQVAAHRAEKQFETWSRGGDLNPDLGLLKAMAEVLQIEADRLYLGWYEEVENPSVETLLRWKAAIQAFLDTYPDLQVDLAGKLEKYVKTLPWSIRRQFHTKRAPQPAAPVVKP
jgi:hypothetical protein